MCAGAKWMSQPDVRRHYMIALGACGRFAEAADIAESMVFDETVEPGERLKYRLFLSVLRKQDVRKVLAESQESLKDRALAAADAGKLALLWGNNEAAENLSAAYQAFFGEKISRTLPVRFFKTPVGSISDWRKVYGTLEKQYCDVHFRISADFLATDVATGPRNIQSGVKGKAGKFMEISALCDIDGVHIFLRVEDPDAQKVRLGFAPGYNTEMYFAPGRNQPYTCIGMEPAAGITYMFETTYNNANHRRPDRKNPAGSFRTETQFTDTDYVQHLFFGWENLYGKLPDRGSEYRYECIAWTPSGSYSWGGSHGVHAPSAWGSLRFDLAPEELNAIRRNILFKTFRKYRMVPRELRNTDIFTIWSDPEVGDPDFYTAKLVPLEKELKTWAAMIREDMSDEDVETVYVRALPRMKGLADEVDRLRRQYLLERITLKGY